MKVDYVRSYDWCGLYVDGQLRAEGHSLDPTHVLDALGIGYATYSADEEWLEESGSLPYTIDEVVKYG